jgi:hypothetical protein
VLFASFQVPGTAKAVSLLGLAFEFITDTFGENARMRGINRGKYSLEPLSRGLKGQMDRAA